jgi:polyribonucleotide nucleotidyltransferase
LFYINKTDSSDVIEIIYSEPGVSIIIEQKETLRTGTPTGKIVRKGKKDLKKIYKKAKNKNIEVPPVSTTEKEAIIEEFKTDKYGILKHTQSYIEKKKQIDRVEYFENLSDEEYLASLEELKD